jgi:hypothetical protein
MLLLISCAVRCPNNEAFRTFVLFIIYHQPGFLNPQVPAEIIRNPSAFLPSSAG